MAKPKKSRAGKTHKPKGLHIPLMLDIAMPRVYVADEQPELAMQIYLRIGAMIDAPTLDGANSLCRLFAKIAIGLHLTYQGIGLDRLPADTRAAVLSALSGLQDISKRYNEHKVIAVRMTEARTLKAAAGRLDEALSLIPMHMWERAELTVKRNEAFIKTMVAEHNAQLPEVIDQANEVMRATFGNGAVGIVQAVAA
jgi:hypothetical protein